jgi:antitoxin ParD1/3/4
MSQPKATNPDRCRETVEKKEEERITFRINKDLLEQVEELVRKGKYPNRSEAIRAGLEEITQQESDE